MNKKSQAMLIFWVIILILSIGFIVSIITQTNKATEICNDKGFVHGNVIDGPRYPYFYKINTLACYNIHYKYRTSLIVEVYNE